jgi:hypothetical protein
MGGMNKVDIEKWKVDLINTSYEVKNLLVILNKM